MNNTLWICIKVHALSSANCYQSELPFPPLATTLPNQDGPDLGLSLQLWQIPGLSLCTCRTMGIAAPLRPNCVFPAIFGHRLLKPSWYSARLAAPFPPDTRTKMVKQSFSGSFQKHPETTLSICMKQSKTVFSLAELWSILDIHLQISCYKVLNQHRAAMPETRSMKPSPAVKIDLYNYFMTSPLATVQNSICTCGLVETDHLDFAPKWARHFGGNWHPTKEKPTPITNGPNIMRIDNM